MAANEVNDIVMRLLAAADHIRGREREEILHHVGKLSRAAVRERTAAVDEMQKLRKKIVQQSAEFKRIENASQSLPATQAPKVS
jgi:transcriptional accessory protein Tex/SPT6